MHEHIYNSLHCLAFEKSRTLSDFYCCFYESMMSRVNLLYNVPTLILNKTNAIEVLLQFRWSEPTPVYPCY